MIRIAESVTPSGVPFSVRNLMGRDQDYLSKASNDNGESFNEMLAGALITLGSKKEGEINPKTVKQMLTLDRKFILVVLRQHTLKFKKLFEFDFEWPLQKGSKSKEKQHYEVEFTHENFPIIPPKWMKEKIAELKADAIKDERDFTTPDGFIEKFPILYQDYIEMLNINKTVSVTLPESLVEVEYQLLDGEIENKWAPTLKRESEIVVNMQILMHSPKMLGKNKSDHKIVKFSFETDNCDILDLEYLRKHIMETEGTIDTFLAIEHQTDKNRSKRVDLVSLPAFFFPSQAL